MASSRKVFDEAPKNQVYEPSWTTMIAGYVRNDDLAAARELLDGMPYPIDVAWNAIIAGYVRRGLYEEAFDTFRRMHSMGIQEDEYTYTSLISACASCNEKVGMFNCGRQVHGYILRTVVEPSQHFILSVNNALITFYTKHDRMVEARRVFDKMPTRDIISWNAVLSGLCCSWIIGQWTTNSFSSDSIGS
ncbi:hypothetical protein TSUD_27100 [Trifolium subterraneum]|uniref:Pentatricopeptide repeat-containing protein n=1 Tax=Trifolium subterraneum TaxID=3900 RepID=A0A2Z6LW95_TRISU|nr:hypothetical protein TSUD_27100 [Trifolium subterraneum]